MPAADLKRDDDTVAGLDAPHGIPDGDDLANALVAHGVSGRHRQPAFGDRHVEVAARHQQRPDDSLLRRRDLGLGGLPPGIVAGLLEHQLLHQ